MFGIDLLIQYFLIRTDGQVANHGLRRDVKHFNIQKDFCQMAHRSKCIRF